MRCRRAKRLLDPYHAGRLSTRRERRLAEHLSACSACNRESSRRRRMERLLKSGSAPPVPEGFAYRTVQAAGRSLGGEHSPAPVWWRPIFTWQIFSQPMRIAAAAALVAGLSLGAFIGFETAPRPPRPVSTERDVAYEYAINAFDEAPAGSLARLYLTSDIVPEESRD